MVIPGVQSAAALANSIKAMMDTSGPYPAMEAIKQCLLAYQKTRDQQALLVAESANKMIEQGSITWDGGSVTVPSSFYHIEWLERSLTTHHNHLRAIEL